MWVEVRSSMQQEAPTGCIVRVYVTIVLVCWALLWAMCQPLVRYCVMSLKVQRSSFLDLSVTSQIFCARMFTRAYICTNHLLY